MPVNFGEPLSMLQRLGEDMEYCDLLPKASKIKSSFEQMAYVVAFSISGYASTVFRTGSLLIHYLERLMSLIEMMIW